MAARRGGDPLEQLLRSDYERLFTICRRLLRDREAAEDATQEAMASIARNLARFDQKSRYSTWSYRIAANAALDEIRRRRRRPVVPLTEDAVETGASPGADCALVSTLTVRAALERIPREQAEALRLRHHLDLEYAEIAAVLGVPVGTVRSRIARGRKAIASLLAEGGDGEGNSSGWAGVKVERPS